MPKIRAGSIELNYETHGEGPPLLLIMGFGMPGAAWLPSLPFMHGFKCIYFDNRGTGYSDKPAGPYTAAEMADDAANLMSALGIDAARVFGVSMGGMIAQELALRHPARVTRLVLGCTTPGGPSARTPAPETLEQMVTASKLMASDPDRAFDLLLPLLYPPEFAAAHPEIKPMMMLGASMMPPTPPETADRALAGLSEFNACERLDQIKCPVLIVHGAKDVLVPPENAALIKRRIPQAELYMIPNAGHGFQASDPLGIHQRIMSWLRI